MYLGPIQLDMKAKYQWPIASKPCQFHLEVFLHVLRTLIIIQGLSPPDHRSEPRKNSQLATPEVGAL